MCVRECMLCYLARDDFVLEFACLHATCVKCASKLDQCMVCMSSRRSARLELAGFDGSCREVLVTGEWPDLCPGSALPDSHYCREHTGGMSQANASTDRLINDLRQHDICLNSLARALREADCGVRDQALLDALSEVYKMLTVDSQVHTAESMPQHAAEYQLLCTQRLAAVTEQLGRVEYRTAFKLACDLCVLAAVVCLAVAWAW